MKLTSVKSSTPSSRKRLFIIIMIIMIFISVPGKDSRILASQLAGLAKSLVWHCQSDLLHLYNSLFSASSSSTPSPGQLSHLTFSSDQFAVLSRSFIECSDAYVCRSLHLPHSHWQRILQFLHPKPRIQLKGDRDNDDDGAYGLVMMVTVNVRNDFPTWSNMSSLSSVTMSRICRGWRWSREAL